MIGSKKFDCIDCIELFRRKNMSILVSFNLIILVFLEVIISSVLVLMGLLSMIRPVILIITRRLWLPMWKFQRIWIFSNKEIILLILFQELNCIDLTSIKKHLKTWDLRLRTIDLNWLKSETKREVSFINQVMNIY